MALKATTPWKATRRTTQPCICTKADGTVTVLHATRATGTRTRAAATAEPRLIDNYDSNATMRIFIGATNGGNPDA